jgi:hypothetical protein
MELLTEVWAGLAEIWEGLSTPVRLGWPMLLVWVLVQILWFRLARVSPHVLARSVSAPQHDLERARNRDRDRERSRSTVKPAARPRVPALRTAGGSPDFLAALGLDQPAQPELSPISSGLTDLNAQSGDERSAYTGRRSDDPPTGSTYR